MLRVKEEANEPLVEGLWPVDEAWGPFPGQDLYQVEHCDAIAKAGIDRVDLNMPLREMMVKELQEVLYEDEATETSVERKARTAR